MKKIFSVKEKQRKGARDMNEQLRALAALRDHSGSFPNIQGQRQGLLKFVCSLRSEERRVGKVCLYV